jgi:beta-lactamase class A
MLTLQAAWLALVLASGGPLERVVSALQPDLSAAYGVLVEDIGSGARLSVNETGVFQSGSVYKLALAWEVLRRVDAGRLSLDAPIEVLDEDTLEVEPFGGPASGDTPTVREALRAMFEVSSNSAAHLLLRLVGRTEFNSAMDDLALYQTRVPEQHGDGDAVTSAEDVGRLLRLIATGAGLSPSSHAEVLDLLAQGGTPDALRETLPDEVCVLDKTGNLEDASNVGALLQTPRGMVILVVLDRGVDPGDARGIIARLGQAAYEEFLE